jgi:hypothetical protein
MDETEFKKTFHDVNETPCVFAKAILRRCATCSRSQKLFIAEREAVACRSPGAHQRCREVLTQLHDKAMFTLHLHHPEQVLPHAKELKVQCGGLLGLQQALHATETSAEIVDDINALLEQAITIYGDLDSLPLGDVIKAIAAFKARGK